MLERSFFYTEEPQIKKVNKAEFEEFIKNYPRELEADCYYVCSPPLISYNDFELANRWPYSIVAKTFLYSDNEGDLYYKPEEQRIYEIMENHEHVFASKTGNMA